jgi:hypothetical protein
MSPARALALMVAEAVGEVADEAVVEAEEEADEPLVILRALILLPHFLLKGWSFCWRFSRCVVVG